MALTHVSVENRLEELGRDLDSFDHYPYMVPVGVVRRMLQDLAGCADADARASYDDGWRAAGALHKREVDHFAELLLQVSAALRGKDAGDGEIVTTIVPDPAIYGWRS